MRVKTTTSVPFALICVSFSCPSAYAVAAGGLQCLVQGRALPDTVMLWQEGSQNRCGTQKSSLLIFRGKWVGFDIESRGSPGLQQGGEGVGGLWGITFHSALT